jgi:hypothetical protein
MCKFKYKGKRYDISVSEYKKLYTCHGMGFIYDGIKHIIFLSGSTASYRSKYLHRIIKGKGLMTSCKGKGLIRANKDSEIFTF